MTTSFLKWFDDGVRSLLFEKFKDDLGIDSLEQDTGRYPKGVALRKLSEKRGKVSLEFINVWRSITSPDWARQRSPLARRGVYTGYTSLAKDAITNIKTQPVKLAYDFWVWSKDLEKINQITEKYLFWQHNNPNVDLVINDLYEIGFQLHFGEVVDESPIEEMYDKGLYFVHRFPLLVDGWVFDLTSLKSVLKIILRFYEDVDPGGTQERSVLLFEETVEEE